MLNKLVVLRGIIKANQNSKGNLFVFPPTVSPHVMPDICIFRIRVVVIKRCTAALGPGCLQYRFKSSAVRMLLMMSQCMVRGSFLFFVLTNTMTPALYPHGAVISFAAFEVRLQFFVHMFLALLGFLVSIYIETKGIGLPVQDV